MIIEYEIRLLDGLEKTNTYNTYRHIQIIYPDSWAYSAKS